IDNNITFNTVDAGEYKSIDIISNTTFGAVNKTVYIKFKATDANGIKSARWQLGNDGDLSGDAAPTGVPNEYKVAIPVDTLRSDTWTLTLKATDNVDKQVSKSLSVKIDNNAPIVTINTPSADVNVNKTITVSGSVSNVGPAGIDQIYLAYSVADTTPDYEALTAADITNNLGKDTKGKWTAIGNNASWTYNEYNTAILTAGIDDQKIDTYYIAVAAICKNGVVAKAYKKVSVDQDSDRPIVTINMNLSDKTSGSYIKNEQGLISGSVIDDDGVSSVDYSLVPLAKDAAGWTNLTSGSTFTYSSASDSRQSIYFRVTDAAGGKFISMATPTTSEQFNAIKLRDNSTNKFGERGSSGNGADTVTYVMMDTAAPVFNTNCAIDPNGLDEYEKQIYYSIDGKSSWDNISTIGSVIFGKYNATDSKLYIKFNATDANGIAVAKYKFGSGSLKNVDTSSDITNGRECICDINLTSEASGTKTLELYIEDKAGKNVTRRYSVEIDNTVPSVTVSTPAGGETIDKTVTVSGTTSDASSGLKEMYISFISDFDRATLSTLTAEYLRTNDLTTDTAMLGKWVKIPLSSAESSNWSYSFNSTLITQSSKSGFQLVVIAIDKNNNIGYNTERAVNIDQDQDRPEVTLSNTNLAGMTSSNRVWHTQKKIYGVVSDRDGVADKVEYKIDTGSWTDAVIGSNNFEIPVEDGDRTIYLRVTDHEGQAFESKTTADNEAIKIIDGAGLTFGYANSTSKDTILYLKVDNNPPTIADDVYFWDYSLATPAYVNASNISTAVFGGASRKTLKLKFSVRDANG
ncbi:MAG: hypothetical protein J6Y01_01630, partial [Spirochaetales bacterium]|nr:hypothetical protein [Spirochaetales bacterium]